MTALKYTSMTIVGALSLMMLPREIANADELIVRVNNIKEAGEIHIAIYDSAEAFEADRGEKGGAAPGITQGTIEMVETGSVTYRYVCRPAPTQSAFSTTRTSTTGWTTTSLACLVSSTDSVTTRAVLWARRHLKTPLFRWRVRPRFLSACDCGFSYCPSHNFAITGKLSQSDLPQ